MQECDTSSGNVKADRGTVTARHFQKLFLRFMICLNADYEETRNS